MSPIFALIPSAHIEETLSVSTWDLEFSRGMPRGMTSYKGGKEVHQYLRYGVDNGVEPLIIDRNSFIDYAMTIGKYPRSFAFSTLPISITYRKTDQYIKINEDGSELKLL